MTVAGAYRFVRSNGIEIEVFEAGEGERLALLLHGFPELAISWRHQIPLLVELGYRVWAPNLRGYGRTTRPADVEAYAIERLLDDVAGLVDAAGAREVTLVAHDWGAAIAWLFAMHRVRPLARLVILNVPHPALFGKALRESWRQRARSWYAVFFQIPRLPEMLLGRARARPIAELFARGTSDPRRIPPDVLEAYRANACEPGALRAMLAWYRAAARGGFARMVRRGFPAIEIPTLVLWGENDVALGKETTYGTHRYVRDLQLHYLPGASHWVQQDAPERVNDELRRFLGAVTERTIPAARGLTPPGRGVQ